MQQHLFRSYNFSASDLFNLFRLLTINAKKKANMADNFFLLIYSTNLKCQIPIWRLFANTFTIEGQHIEFLKALIFFSWRRVIKCSCLYVSVSHYFTFVQCVSFIWTLAFTELNLILIITHAERSTHTNSRLADLDYNAILKEFNITLNIANNNNN